MFMPWAVYWDVDMLIVWQAEERAINALLDAYRADDVDFHEHITVERISAHRVRTVPLWAAKQWRATLSRVKMVLSGIVRLHHFTDCWSLVMASCVAVNHLQAGACHTKSRSLSDHWCTSSDCAGDTYSTMVVKRASSVAASVIWNSTYWTTRHVLTFNRQIKWHSFIYVTITVQPLCLQTLSICQTSQCFQQYLFCCCFIVLRCIVTVLQCVACKIQVVQDTSSYLSSQCWLVKCLTDWYICLQCFDAVGWAAGKAFGL